MSENQKGILYLIPVPITEESEWSLDAAIVNILKTSTVIICERIRTCRRHIKSFLSQDEFDKLVFHEFDKHRPDSIPVEILDALDQGLDVLLFSEAGCPCIADPGYRLVSEAHARNIRVHPLVGPSSILLALMASGLQAQFFEFHGYLPKNDAELVKKLRYIEQQVLKYKRTQIFMETPYRNARLYDQMLRTMNGGLHLCVAKNLNGPKEEIFTTVISSWRKRPHPFTEKEPAIFIIGAS